MHTPAPYSYYPLLGLQNKSLVEEECTKEDLVRVLFEEE